VRLAVPLGLTAGPQDVLEYPIVEFHSFDFSSFFFFFFGDYALCTFLLTGRNLKISSPFPQPLGIFHNSHRLVDPPLPSVDYDGVLSLFGG